MSDFALTLTQVSKTFDVDIAVHDLSLQLAAEQILALVGPSGCGKTTALRLIAGFERPDSGSIQLAGQVIADSTRFVPPEKRGIGMVFQDYALFPHLSVKDNVAFGVPRDQKDLETRLSSMLALVGLEPRAARFPHELSGGERQRVALARALLPQPKLVLLDEPFSNLDADLRVKMREEVRVILKGIRATAIFVTHDQEEAMYIGDQLAVMNRGHIEQVGSPEQVFHQPQERFVAEFMGGTDFLPGWVVADGIQTEVGLIEQSVDAPIGAEVELALRPDDVAFEPDPAGESLILARHFMGAMNLYRLRLPSGRLLHAYAPHHAVYSTGLRVQVRAAAGHPLACFRENKAVNLN